MHPIGNLSTKDTNLNAAGVRRGAFQNSGSKDAGPDPNWDWKNGKYVYPKGFAEHLKNNSDPNETDLGPSLEALAKQSGDDHDHHNDRFPLLVLFRMMMIIIRMLHNLSLVLQEQTLDADLCYTRILFFRRLT